MPFPSVQEVIKDPDFLGLPESEKKAVLMQIDPDFKGLPEPEQSKVVQAFTGTPQAQPQRRAQPSGILGTLPGDIPHAPSGRNMEEYNQKFENAARAASNYYRPALEGAGGVGGSLAGAAGGPLTALGGGTLGYGMGHKAADALDQALGIQQPRTVPGELRDTAQTLKEGAMWEMGGLAAGKTLETVFKGGKLAIQALRKPFKPQDAAKKILVANTSAGPIYARNKKLAKQLQREIPGLKLSVGQQTMDPALIKLERGAIRKSPQGAWAIKDQVANNDDAIMQYYRKNFPEAEGVDNVVDALKGVQARLEGTAKQAARTVDDIAGNLPQQAPQQTGEDILSGINTAKQPVKKQMEYLDSVIPDYPMKFDNYDQAVTDALSSRKAAPEEREFIEKLNNTLKDLRRERGESTHISQAMRRAINNAIGKADATVPSATPRLMQIKEALINDIDEVSKLARTGKIADYKGRMIDADKLAEELERNTLKIAEMQTATAPDMDAMIKALDERGIPVMQQRAESPKGFNERIINDYKRIFKAEVPTKQVYGGGGGNIKIKEDFVGSAYGQDDLILKIEKDGKTVGSLNYSVYDNKPSINMVEVSEGNNKKGYGSMLVDELQKKFPDQEILWGMTTPEGTALRNSLTKKKVRIPGITDKKKQLAQVSDKLNQYEKKAKSFYEIENPTPKQRSEFSESVKDWNELHDLKEELSEFADVKDYKILIESKNKAGTAPPEIQSLLDRNDQIKNILSEVSPGQDVAAQIKAFNDYASGEYFPRFDKGAVKNATAKGQELAGTRTKLENIPNLFKTASGADDLIRAVGPEKAGGMMRGHLNYDLLDYATDPAGNIVPKKLAAWIKKNRPILKKFGFQDDYKGLVAAQEIADTAQQNAKQFERSAAASLLKADPERAIASAIRGNNMGKAASELLGQVQDNPAAKRGLQKAFADHIFDQIQTTATNIKDSNRIGSAKFQNVLKKYAPAINALYKGQPEKKKALASMQKAIQAMNRNTASPFGGGSDTAENMASFMEQLAGPAMGSSAAVNAARLAGRMIKKYGQSQVDDVLLRAMFDPEYAEILTKTAKGKMPVDTAIKTLDRKIIDLNDFRKRTAAGSAAGMFGATTTGED